MSDEKSSGGLGLGGFVFIVFLIFKLAKIGDVVDWSWWWVCSPLWIGSIIWLVFVIFAWLIYKFGD